MGHLASFSSHSSKATNINLLNLDFNFCTDFSIEKSDSVLEEIKTKRSLCLSPSTIRILIKMVFDSAYNRQKQRLVNSIHNPPSLKHTSLKVIVEDRYRGG